MSPAEGQPPYFCVYEDSAADVPQPPPDQKVEVSADGPVPEDRLAVQFRDRACYPWPGESIDSISRDAGGFRVAGRCDPNGILPVTNERGDIVALALCRASPSSNASETVIVGIRDQGEDHEQRYEVCRTCAIPVQGGNQ